MKSRIILNCQAIKCLLINLFNKPVLPEYNYEDDEVLIIKNSGNKEKKSIPKIIWMYWHDLELPILVSKIIQNLKERNPTYEIRLLNKETVVNYFTDLKFSRDTRISHQTDIIRLLLLQRFGGVWIDATTILYKNIDWVNIVNDEGNYDIIAFYRDNSTIDKRFPIIESWFLAAPANSCYINNWLDILMPLVEKGSVKYFDEMRNRNDYDELKQGIINPEYLLIYLAGQVSSRKSSNYNAYFIKSEASALLIQDTLITNYKINYALCFNYVYNIKYPIIKLCSGDRMFVNIFYKWNLISKKSIIGRILYK